MLSMHKQQKNTLSISGLNPHATWHTPHKNKQTWKWSIEEEDEQISSRKKQNANLKFMNSKSTLAPYHNYCQLHFNSHLKHEPQPSLFNQYHLQTSSWYQCTPNLKAFSKLMASTIKAFVGPSLFKHIAQPKSSKCINKTNCN